jgi:hypothetical protein
MTDNKIPGGCIVIGRIGISNSRTGTQSSTRNMTNRIQLVHHALTQGASVICHFSSASPQPPTKLEAKLIASARMTVLNKNESIAWTSESRLITFEVIATSET